MVIFLPVFDTKICHSGSYIISFYNRASDNRIEDEGGSSNQLALPVEKFGVAAEEEQPPALPPRTTSIQRSAASGFARKSPLKANTGSSGSVRKSPLKTWNRQAGTPNNTGIDHLRPNTSSGSSLKTINKSGSSRKPLHVSLWNISILIIYKYFEH